MLRLASIGLLFTFTVASAASAGELLVMAGDEPLRSLVNESKGSVRLLMIGAPT